MRWDVLVTDKAESDISSAADYIAYELNNPEAANHLLDEIDSTVDFLSKHPKSNSFVADALLASLGIRSVSVNRYILFYMLDKHAKKIYLIRFLHSKRDWATILTDEFAE